jgi:Fe-S cluster biosynthesis and repair protein YggX
VSRIIQCAVLGREAEGLARPPYPGPLGLRIYETVSKEAWQKWLAHQTMLINEYRLSPMEPKARTYLEQEMEKFLFGGGSEKPPDFRE